MKKLKCKVGNIVRLEAVDTTKYVGNEYEYPLMVVYVYGRVESISDETIVIVMAEEKSDTVSNFDERIVFPVSCILNAEVLIKGKK